MDLVYDSVGGDDLYRVSRPLLRRGGKYVTAVGPIRHGGSEPVTVRTILWTIATLVPRFIAHGLWRRDKFVMHLDFDTAELDTPRLAAMIEAGQLRVRADPQVFDLASLGKAHAKVETNHSSGRVVVAVADL